MNTAPVHPGDILANKYRVDRVLGVGGMGVVVQATHIQLDERVALKFMLPEAMVNASVAGRFLREARLAVKLKSEHVAKVMDVGTLESGAPYIVMEYLNGTDLNDLLQRHGPLPFADVAEYVIQTCDAIAEAHALGIVHRDLKPANLFLTQRADGAPLVKVLDFGISKANALTEASGGLTKTSTMMGSPFYMSPEQMRSAKDVDQRSDVWSLGVIVYQLLTARLPFESDTLGGIMAQVLHDDPATLSSHRPDVPHAFEAIVRRCLHRDRNARAQNVAEIALTLAPYAPTRVRPIADRIAALVGTCAPIGQSAQGLASHSGGLGSTSGSGQVIGALPPPGFATGGPVTTGGGTRPSHGAGIALGAIAFASALAVGALFWHRSGHSRTVDSESQAARTSVATSAAGTTTAAPVTIAVTAALAESGSAEPQAIPSTVASVVAAPKRSPAGLVPARGGRPAALTPHPPPPALPAPATVWPKKNVLDDRN